MPGTMSKADLVADLKSSLHDAAKVFTAPSDADFERFLLLALPDLTRKRPRTLLGSVVLQAGVPMYVLSSVPGMMNYKTHQWGQNVVPLAPWEPGYPGAVPRVSATQTGEAWSLMFDPAPTAKHLAAWGSTFKFWYVALHTVGAAANDTSVAVADRGLLLLRAQAEAMSELSIRNAGKPVTMRDGLSGQPRNGTPGGLAEALFQRFKEECA